MDLNYQNIMKQLEELGSEKTKYIYMKHGAQEPLYGIVIKDLKPLAKKIKINQILAEKLYNSGNYDAMYLAGMIADPEVMTEKDFEHWIEKAYFYMISDYTVAIVLADSPLAFIIANKWIASGDELKMSAGWFTYCWMLRTKKDKQFNLEVLKIMLGYVKNNIHSSPNRTRYAMNSFVISLGIFYLPLHKEAVAAANEIGKVEVYLGNTKCKVQKATDYIAKTAHRGRLGYKRPSARS